MRRFLLFLLSAAILPVAVCAQSRGGGGASHAAPAMSAPHASAAPHSAPTPYSGGLHPTPGGHYLRTRNGTVIHRTPTPAITAPLRSGGRRVLSQDVPGLGFDYAHLNAVNGGRGRRNGRNGFDRDRDRNRPFLAYFPFYGGGYYLPLYDDSDSSESPAAADEVQADDYAPEEDYRGYPPAPRPADTATGFPAPPPPASASGPQRPTEEYVFVRRDGTLFFAVGYTWENGTLRYVTSEGLRRSVASDSLDLGATQQFNEQRGLSFRLPAA